MESVHSSVTSFFSMPTHVVWQTCITFKNLVKMEGEGIHSDLGAFASALWGMGLGMEFSCPLPPPSHSHFHITYNTMADISVLHFVR